MSGRGRPSTKTQKLKNNDRSRSRDEEPESQRSAELGKNPDDYDPYVPPKKMMSAKKAVGQGQTWKKKSLPAGASQGLVARSNKAFWDPSYSESDSDSEKSKQPNTYDSMKPSDVTRGMEYELGAVAHRAIDEQVELVVNEGEALMTHLSTILRIPQIEGATRDMRTNAIQQMRELLTQLGTGVMNGRYVTHPQELLPDLFELLTRFNNLLEKYSAQIGEMRDTESISTFRQDIIALIDADMEKTRQEFTDRANRQSKLVGKRVQITDMETLMGDDKKAREDETKDQDIARDLDAQISILENRAELYNRYAPDIAKSKRNVSDTRTKTYVRDTKLEDELRFLRELKKGVIGEAISKKAAGGKRHTKKRSNKKKKTHKRKGREGKKTRSHKK
jgi:hypothetical protein